MRYTSDPKKRALGKPSDDPEVAQIEELRKRLSQSLSSESSKEHPLAKKSESALAKGKTNERHILEPRLPGVLNIRVTRESLDRATRIFSALLFGLQSEGWLITVKVEPHERTCVQIDGQDVFFRLEETVKQVVTKKPRRDPPLSSWDYDRTVAYVATGELAVVIENYIWRDQVRKTWRDGKHQRVEDLIPDIIAGIRLVALAERRYAEQQKAEENARQQRLQRIATLQQQIQDEQKRIRHLLKEVSRWNRANTIRAFVEAACKIRQAQNPDISNPLETEFWRKWVLEQADRIDPLRENPPSVLDRQEELAGLIRREQRPWEFTDN